MLPNFEVRIRSQGQKQDQGKFCTWTRNYKGLQPRATSCYKQDRQWVELSSFIVDQIPAVEYSVVHTLLLCSG